MSLSSPWTCLQIKTSNSDASGHVACTYIVLKVVYTVNGERFTGLNFHVFHGFQEHRESFPVNIYKLCVMALVKYCKT